jgi:hypothetical protein
VSDPDNSEHTRIIRRAPVAPPPRPSGPPPGSTEDTRTGIIRRAPTGPFSAQRPAEPRTTHIPTPADPPTGLIPPPLPGAVSDPSQALDFAPTPGTAGGSRSAIATCVVAILSGWAVSVVGTDLITGWWQTDRLFCLGVGFLTFVFAASTISGVVTVLLRRAVGRYLITTGAVVALLTFGAVFIAGAKIAWPVYLIPLLPIVSVILAFLPGTRRWTGTR